MDKLSETFLALQHSDRTLVQRAYAFAERRADGHALSIEQQEALANGMLILWDNFCITDK